MPALVVVLWVTSGCGPSGVRAPGQPTAVDQPSTSPASGADAAAGSTGVGRVPGDAPPPLDPITLIGTWSFDRTCASEDGMQLAADGTAGTDSGNGLWAVDGEHRLVMIIREQEMGEDADPKAERVVWRITAAKPVGDDFAGRIDPVRPGAPVREFTARRCAEAK